VVATAGHIDHGKTALVRALTGMETDRLKEEIRRGVTIELGFAFLGENITIIDVPGHERFIKTMAAGVSTVDLALLVVAADDGVMPQTREHLAILHLLGIPHIFVILTKIEGLEEDWLELVEAELREILPPALKTNARFFRCDSLSGEGIEALKEAILDFSSTVQPRPDSGVFRLPVDRVFSMRGYGTIITGTILGGKVKSGDRLLITPQGSEVRARGLQSHGQDRRSLGVGERAALNLIGAGVSQIQRGDWICEEGAFSPTEVLDVALLTLRDSPELKNRDRVRLHIGTNESLGRVVLFGREVAAPGEKVFAQIVLETPIMATRGDRFVVRRYSPVATLGGGQVLDPVPQRKRRSDPDVLDSFEILDKSSDQDALEQKIKISGKKGLPINEARTFTNVPLTILQDQVRPFLSRGSIIQLGSGENSMLVSEEVVREARREILRKMDDFHRQSPQLLGKTQAHLVSELSVHFPDRVLEYAIDDLLRGDLVLEKGYLRREGHSIKLDSQLEELSNRLEVLLEAGGIVPPGMESIRKQLAISEKDLNRVLGIMSQQGRVVRMADGSPWAMSAVRSAWAIVRGKISEGEGKTPSELRAALGSPRRYTIALLEYFDGIGLTSREEDRRLPGPNFNTKF